MPDAALALSGLPGICNHGGNALMEAG